VNSYVPHRKHSSCNHNTLRSIIYDLWLNDSIRSSLSSLEAETAKVDIGSAIARDNRCSVGFALETETAKVDIGSAIARDNRCSVRFALETETAKVDIGSTVAWKKRCVDTNIGDIRDQTIVQSVHDVAERSKSVGNIKPTIRCRSSRFALETETAKVDIGSAIARDNRCSVGFALETETAKVDIGSAIARDNRCSVRFALETETAKVDIGSTVAWEDGYMIGFGLSLLLKAARMIQREYRHSICYAENASKQECRGTHDRVYNIKVIVGMEVFQCKWACSCDKEEKLKISYHT
jgi:hypothetical protein